MVRRIIEIDGEKCDGCGLCAAACHEGAIGMEEGKAVLLRDDYCDGLGDCLPTCPAGAIRFVEREAAAYDEAAVKANQLAKKAAALIGSAPVTRSGCGGSMPRTLSESSVNGSCLGQWPVQIKLLPVEGAFYQDASLLIAADCSAFTCGDFHQRYMKGRVTMIGCPKLDGIDYSEKLAEILRLNPVRDVTVVRMDVPCCGGLQRAAETALDHCGKRIPGRVITLRRDGTPLKEEGMV